MAPIKKPPRERRPTFIKEWRRHRGFNQERAAELAGVDRSTISRIESGMSPYDQDILEKLADAYMCAPDDLIAVDPAKPDISKHAYNIIRRASPEKQSEALRIIEALLKIR